MCCRERAHCIFLDPIVQQCEHLHAQRQSPLAVLPHEFDATACAHVSGQGKAQRSDLHTAQVMSNGMQKDRVLTMFWMTSFRPGQSPPQVTTAAVTCQSPTTACQQCASMYTDKCRLQCICMHAIDRKAQGESMTVRHGEAT